MHTLFDDAIKKRGSDWISFEFGTPSDDLLPSDLVKEAVIALLDSSNDQHLNSLQYGPQLGSHTFREAIKKWASSESTSTITCTAGASQSLKNIAHMFTCPSTIILVEDPTYFIGIRVLKEALPQNVFKSVPMSRSDHDLLDLDALEEMLSSLSSSSHANIDANYGTQAEQQLISSIQEVETSQQAAAATTKDSASHKVFHFLLYLVPTFSNPSSKTMSLESRHRLVKLARKHDVLIVCDDVYQMLSFSSSSTSSLPQKLIDIDLMTSSTLNSSNVISNNSFSKILGPGVRLGWIETSLQLQQYFAKSPLLSSGGSANQFTSNAVAVAINNGSLPKHVAFLCTEYESRCTAFCDALQKSLPSTCSFLIPKGGFFVWVKVANLRDSLTTSIILSTLLANDPGKNPYGIHLEKVSFAPGSVFGLLDSSYQDCIRLSFAMYSVETLIEGAKRLGRVLKSCCTTTSI